MGGSSKQVNPQQASAADAGASAAAAAQGALATQMGAQQGAAFNKLFGGIQGTGSGATLTGSGVLSSYLDPNNLNAAAKGPTGPYSIMYNNALGNLSAAQAAQRGSLSQGLQNRGFGMSSPSGFGATQALAQSLGQAQQQGQLFSDYTNQGYQDALRNLWSAAGILSGQGTSSGQNAVNANNSGGQIYANLYGTAGRQAQGSSLLGSILGAGATIGSAFIP